jgi:ketosteroid isomerase-like protein
MKHFVPLAALILFASCCSTAPMTTDVQPGDAEAAINRLNKELMTGAIGGNPAFVDTYYADDAVLLPPNMPSVRGKEAIRQLWGAMVGSGTFDLKLTSDRVIQSGDMATEIGHFDLVLTPKAAGAGPIHDVGKYLVAWRKIGGKWKAIADMYSSDNPPPPAH